MGTDRCFRRETLREASPEVQRQVFEAFELQILYDKAGRKIEISATVSDVVALPKEGLLVVPREVAGARFVSRYHRRRNSLSLRMHRGCRP